MSDHPFVAVLKRAGEVGYHELELIDFEEPRGRFVRLALRNPPVLFKRALDHGTNIDRVSFPYHDGIRLDEAVIEQGPDAVLALIQSEAARLLARRQELDRR